MLINDYGYICMFIIVIFSNRTLIQVTIRKYRRNNETAFKKINTHVAGYQRSNNEVCNN